MNVYSALPLIALITNLATCFYILYINPKNNLNRFFSLFAGGLALWSLATFYNFNSTSVVEVVFWEKIGTIGAVLTSVFLFHFVLIYTKNKYTVNKKILALLYSSGILLIVIEYTTDFFTVGAIPSYYGFAKITGTYEIVLNFYVMIIVIVSIFLCYKFFIKTSSKRIKKQIIYLNIALLIPLIGGIFTQFIPTILNIELITLTSSFTTLTSVIILFSIFRYQFVSPKSFSIQKKLVVMFFVIIFIMSSSTLVATRVITYENVENMVFERLSAVVHNRADTIQMYLKEHADNVRHFSNNKEFIDLLEIDKKNDSYSDYYEHANDRIHSIIQTSNHVDQIHIINNSGICVISSKGVSEIGKSKVEHLDFDEENKSVHITDIFLCHDTKKPAITFTAQIKSLGSIIVKYDVKKLYDILTDRTSLGKTGETYIVNQTGIMVSPSRFYNESENYENIIFKQRVDTENFHNCMLHKDFSDEELKDKHEEIKITYNYRNQRVLGTHEYIYETDWAFLAEIDESEAFSDVFYLQNMLTVIITSVSIIILIFAMLYSKTFSNPIKKLTNYAKEIKKGNLNVISDVKTNDEIGELSDSFNKMTKSLKRHTENLEAQVNERTKEMQEKVDELKRFKKVTVGRELKMVELKKQIEQIKEDNNSGGKNS